MAQVVHVGKRGGCASTPQAFIHRLMIAEALRGERVVCVTGGDPFVFGSSAEECDAHTAAQRHAVGTLAELVGLVREQGQSSPRCW